MRVHAFCALEIREPTTVKAIFHSTLLLAVEITLPPFFILAYANFAAVIKTSQQWCVLPRKREDIILEFGNGEKEKTLPQGFATVFIDLVDYSQSGWM